MGEQGARKGATEGGSAQLRAAQEHPQIRQRAQRSAASHLRATARDHLRQYVGLRGYGQRDPLNEYKSEAFALFEGLLSKLRTDVVRQLMHLQVSFEQPPMPMERSLPQMQTHHIDPFTGEDDSLPA